MKKKTSSGGFQEKFENQFFSEIDPFGRFMRRSLTGSNVVLQFLMYTTAWFLKQLSIYYVTEVNILVTPSLLVLSSVNPSSSTHVTDFHQCDERVPIDKYILPFEN